MAHRHDAGPKPRRQKTRSGAPKAKTGAKPRAGVDFIVHAVFGAIPLVETSMVLADGSVHRYRECDRDYAPPLPKGAVRGNVRAQSFCLMCHTPRYFYVDVPCVCVECRVPFVFAAAEQKHWYEVLKFHFDSVPVRCVGCRRKRRSEKSLQQELRDAKALLKARPDSASAVLRAARAIVRLHERTAQGNLAEALAFSRKARRLLKNHPPAEACEADFWEAQSHALSGRAGTARPLFERYLEHARGRESVPLVTEAKRWLAQTPSVE